MTSLDIIATKIDGLKESHDSDTKEIVRRLDLINGTVTQHDERIGILEKDSIRKDGTIALQIQEFQLTKGFVMKFGAGLVGILAAVETIVNLMTR